MFDPERNEKQIEALQLMRSDATHLMFEGGSRSGKTAIIIYALLVRACKRKCRQLVVRYRFNHVKQSIWKDTLPAIVDLAFEKQFKNLLDWNKSDFVLTFPNGSEIWIGGLDDKARTDKILGTEYATIFFNECSQISYSSVETALSRLAQQTGLKLKAYYDQNPPNKKHWTYLQFHEKLNPEDKAKLSDPADYAYLQMHPKHNEKNIAPGYIDNILKKMSAKKRKRFLDGEYSDDAEGALWNSDMIANTRWNRIPNCAKVCVAVDPAVTSNPDSNETGIVTMGKLNEHIFAWRDDTCIATPAGWARKAVQAYWEEKADCIVCETNQGGDLVVQNIKNIDKRVKVVKVHATRGKYVRAEPISALMEPDEQGKYKNSRAHICGMLPDLELELTSWSPVENEDSPNRLDAYVWGGHWLLGTHKSAGAWGTPPSAIKIIKR